jgi:hypothetical protein
MIYPFLVTVVPVTVVLVTVVLVTVVPEHSRVREIAALLSQSGWPVPYETSFPPVSDSFERPSFHEHL